MHFLPSLIAAVFIGTVVLLEEASCGNGYASGRSNYGSGNSNDVRYGGNYGGSGYPQRMGTGPGGAATVYDYLGINNEVPYYTAMFKEMNNFAVTGGMGTIGLGDQVVNLNGPYLNQINGGSSGPDYGGSAGYGNGRANYGRNLGAYSGASNGGSFGRRQNSFW